VLHHATAEHPRTNSKREPGTHKDQQTETKRQASQEVQRRAKAVHAKTNSKRELDANKAGQAKAGQCKEQQAKEERDEGQGPWQEKQIETRGGA